MPAPLQLVEHYQRLYGTPPAFTVRAPGRVDLIGAHVDYNDGYVLPATISRGVWLAVGPATGDLTYVAALDFDAAVQFNPARLDERRDADGNPLPTWALYPAGVAWALRGAGLETPALNATLAGDVPIGAGLSSSAAVEVAFATAWRALAGWEVPLMQLAQVCLKAENDYVGVSCGLMDQFASAFGRKGEALLLDCRTLDWEALPLPPGTTLVVADTATRRQLTEGGLNTRHDECRQAVSLLKPHLPHIEALRDVSRDNLARLAHHLPQPIRSRAQHVVDECARVLQAADALRRGDADAVGRLMNDSQRSSRDLYASSGPELDAMWEAASAHPACYGGRFIGAGFAGCLVFLVQSAGADAFIAATAQRFIEATGLVPDLYVTHASKGAEVLPTG